VEREKQRRAALINDPSPKRLDARGAVRVISSSARASAACGVFRLPWRASVRVAPPAWTEFGSWRDCATGQARSSYPLLE
jgi:hypothetical protein